MTDTIERGTALQRMEQYVARVENATTSRERRTVFVEMVDDMELLAAIATESEAAIAPMLQRLRAIPGQLTRTTEYARAITQARRTHRRRSAAAQLERAVTNQRRLGDVFDNLPEGMDALIIPQRYDVGPNGISRIRANREGEPETIPVAMQPLFITAQGRDIADNTMSNTLTWQALGTQGWVSKTVGRGTICDGRKLIELAEYGAPVNSGNSKDIVQYLNAFEAANAVVLPTINATKRMGWQHDNGRMSFMLTDVHIQPPDGDGSDITLFPPEGLRHVAAGWVASGSPDRQDVEWEEWRNLWRIASQHPIISLMVYASVASVFLEPLSSLRGEKPKPFFVDLSGETSTGKTTALRMAASVWGNPDESADGTVYKWSSTFVGVERLAGFLHSLPLFLDETKVADPRLIPKIIYMVCNGRGKTRGDAGAGNMRKTATWRLIAHSTGEQPLPSFSQDGGTIGRVVCFTGQPLRGSFAECMQAAADINAGAVTHYGQLGRRVATYLVHNRASWPELKAQWEESKRTYSKLSIGEVGGRIAGYIALIDLAKRVSEALGLPKPAVDPIETMVAVLRSSLANNSRPAEAFLLVYSLCVQHSRHFIGTPAHESLRERGAIDIYGRWSTHNDKWKGLYILKPVLERFLKVKGINLNEVIDSWYKRGMLLCDKSKRTKQVRIGRSGSVPAVCFNRKTVEDIASFDSIVTTQMPPATVSVPELGNTVHTPPGDVKDLK